MDRRRRISVLVGLFALVMCVVSKANPQRLAASAPADANATNLVRGPLYFEKNTGRHPDWVEFVARARGSTIYLAPTQATIVLQAALGKQRETGANARSRGMLNGAVRNEPDATAQALTIRLLGASPRATGQGLERQGGKINYFTGNDPSRWITGVPTYARVQFPSVYPGIDLQYYGTSEQDRSIEYDFVVRPGADPKRIAFHLEGADNVRVSPEGDLVAKTTLGDVRVHRPVAYQRVGASRRAVACRYDAKPDEGRIGVRVAKYDTSRPLIIDPILEYSTYVGGSAEDAATDIAVDSAGNVYVSAVTYSSDMPTTAGAWDRIWHGSRDIVVMKLGPSGTSLVYATYLGSSGTDHPASIAVDSSGAVYVAGQTDSAGFPTTLFAYDVTHNGDIDGTITKLDPSGAALIYSTFYGGLGQDGCASIATDSDGAAYVTGDTQSADLPTTAGAFDRTKNGGSDAFVAKLSADGSSLVYATYVGGDANDWGTGIAVSATGQAHIVGATNSAGFPMTTGVFDVTHNGSYDAFITKLNAAGTALVYSTFLGGTDYDEAYSVVVDGAGSAYVSGRTMSADLPTTPGAFDRTYNGDWDLFAARVNLEGSNLIYSTYIGTAGTEGSSRRMAVDGAGSLLLTGSTSNAAFPATLDAFDVTLDGPADAFLLVLNQTGTGLVYSTLIGGSAEDRGTAVAAGSGAKVWVCGYTYSANWPTTASGYDRTHNGGLDCFVARFSMALPVATTTYATDRTGTITENVTLTGWLKRNSDGAWLPGKTLKFYVDSDYKGSAVTSASGRADLAWPITPGASTREIRVVFEGDAEYTGSQATGTLYCLTHSTKMSGVDRTARITAYTVLRAWLYRLDNVPVAAKSVQFLVDGTSLGSAPTSTTGRSQIGYTVADGSGSGLRNIQADWAGDAGYGPSSCSNTLTVLPATPYIWVHPRQVPLGGVARLYAYFRRLKDYQKQEGKTVTFRIDGTFIASVATGSGSNAGIARYQYTTVQPKGSHTIRCEFAGDAWVDAGYGEASLTIY